MRGVAAARDVYKMVAYGDENVERLDALRLCVLTIY